MKFSKTPEAAHELEEVRRHVRMDHLLIRYKDRLIDHMRFIEPSQLSIDFAAVGLKPERFLVLLPSPFSADQWAVRHGNGTYRTDHSNSVIVYLDNNTWEDSLSSRPSDIPNDIFGFVMAYEGCSLEEAVATLSIFAKEIRESDLKQLEGQIAGIREVMEQFAERVLALTEASNIRNQILRRLAN